MTSTPRIQPAPITGVFGMMVKRFSMKLLGEVPEPIGIYLHNRPVLKSFLGISSKAQKWSACDENLKSFAHMAVSAQVGCSWCLDFGYFHAHNEGLDERKASQVPVWRTSKVFTPLEREVMGFAEAMTESDRSRGGVLWRREVHTLAGCHHDRLPSDRDQAMKEPAMINKLDDVWASRDFPVLREAARVLDRGDGPVTAAPLTEATGLTQQEVFSAFDALVPGYLTGEPADTLGGRMDVFFAGITERGRRAVGLWPSGESVDALVDALRQAEEAASDPEEKSAIRRAAGAVLGVGRDVMTDVMAAVITKQINGA